jgi:hypothetical protein
MHQWHLGLSVFGDRHSYQKKRIPGDFRDIAQEENVSGWKFLSHRARLFRHMMTAAGNRQDSAERCCFWSRIRGASI